MTDIPPGDWFCEPCTTFGNQGCYVTCFLCPSQGGLLRETTMSVATSKLQPICRDYTSYHKFGVQIIPAPILIQKKGTFCFKIETPLSEIAGEETEFGRGEKTFVGDSTDGCDSSPSFNIPPPWSPAPFDQSISRCTMEAIGFPHPTRRLYHNAPQTANCWVHMSCLQSNPQIRVLSKDKILKLDFPTVKPSPWACCICEFKSGLLQKCSVDGCKVYFHTECARRLGFKMRMETDDGANLGVLCAKHSRGTPQHTIDAVKNQKEKELRAFFEGVQKAAHGHENATGKAARGRGWGVREDRPTTEAILRHLNPEDKHFMTRFKAALMTKKTSQTIISLKRSKNEAHRIRFSKSKLGSGDFYDKIPSSDYFVWEIMGASGDTDGKNTLHRFREIHEMVQRVKAHASNYFKRLPCGEFQKINDIYVDPSDIVQSSDPIEAYEWLACSYFGPYGQPEEHDAALPSRLDTQEEQNPLPNSESLPVQESKDVSCVQSQIDIEFRPCQSPLDVFHDSWTRFFSGWSGQESLQAMTEAFRSLPLVHNQQSSGEATEGSGRATHEHPVRFIRASD